MTGEAGDIDSFVCLLYFGRQNLQTITRFFFPLLKRVISAEGCDHSDQQQSELPQFSRNRDYIGYDFWETRE